MSNIVDHRPRWASIVDLCERYGVTEEWLRALCTNGRLRGWFPPPSVGADPKRAMYSEADVETVLSELTEHQLLEPMRLAREKRQLEKVLTFGQRYGTSPGQLRKLLKPKQTSLDFTELELRALAAAEPADE